MILLNRKRLLWGKRDRKADAVAKELDDAFLAWGASVAILDAAGDGIPDRLIGIQGINRLVEYKTAKNKLRESQEVFHAYWRGSKEIAREKAHVTRIIGEMRLQAQRLALVL
jgi:hypothetical protein